MPLIEIRGLTKLYRMGDSIVRALDGVDLTIEQGEFVAITGASGSGKSTMMHLLGCLDRPTAGCYRLNNQDVSRLSDGELAVVRNQQIGFVFQTFNLINRTNAVENVAVPLFYARLSNIRDPARRALERVGLTSRAHHNPNELSGGERQRVAIARAIVNDPPLLLADEPTGNLDSRTGDQIMEIFHELNRQGVTIIMVTHEPDIARQARRIVLMRDGHIVSDRATPDGGIDPSSRHGRELVAVEPVNEPEFAACAGADATRPNGYPVVQPAFTPLKMRGATPSLVCGILAIASYAVALALFIIAQKWALALGYKPPDQMEMGTPAKMPPVQTIVLSLAGFFTIILGLVLAIIAFVWGIKALGRIRREPGAWLGRWHARIGAALGAIAILLPLAYIVLAVAKVIQVMKTGKA